jgi:OOP family OmpA-OmpF porin
MNKKMWLSVVAAAGLALSAASFHVAAQSNEGYWADAANTVWKDGSGMCWRAGYWTPALANEECDPDLLKKPMEAPKAQPPRPRPVANKVTLAADVLFDFDKSVIKPEGRARLDDLVSKIGGINLEVVIAIGHTDSIGSDAYNQKLSVRRAESVKAYLVSKGIPANRIYTEGKGEKQPVASNKTKEGRAKNRRVEIEVIGTRK